MEEKYYEILRHYVNPNDCATVVKQLLSLHNVSQQRELLIEAFDLINIHDGNREKITKLVDITLKSINCG